MSLLFDQQVSLQASFTTKPASKQENSESVLLASALYKCLIPFAESHGLFISILPIVSSARSPLALPCLTCRAIENDGIDGLVIPTSWLTAYKHIFAPTAQKRVLVSATQPVPLSEVFISALSSEAYEKAISEPSFLEQFLCDETRILRQGAALCPSPDGLGPFEYRLDTLEPTLQGYAEKGKTTFIVTSPYESLDEKSFTDEPDGPLTSSDIDEDLEIDEAFLANSIVQPVYNSISPALSNGHASEQEVLHSDMIFRTVPLSSSLNASYEDCTLYIRTTDLGRLGILNGDWAVARCRETSKCRLVRITADDFIVETLGIVKGFPTLLHNFSCEDACFISSISLHPSPFGSREPVVPTARSVTIARVASPFSINNIYQPLFLDAVRRYFEGRKRLVKQGDLIVVGLDTDDVLRIQDSQESNEAPSLAEQYPANPARVNEVVFFMITNVEYNMPPGDSESIPLDAYFGSTVGELGCWIDPESTRMIQSGLEHSRVPDMGQHISSGIVSGWLSEMEARSSTSEKPIHKLHALASVISEHRGVDYNLQLSVLLKGARGVGKFTAVSEVSRYLGIHLLEVNCYDIVRESEAKTEAFLHTRFENATACSPCLLVLRHLEALAQTTQTPESGKEPVVVNALRECLDVAHQAWKMTGYPVIVCGTTSQPERVPPGVISCFKHEITFEAPDESERYRILKNSLKNAVISPDVSLSDLAQQTAAFLAADLSDLVARAEAAAIERANSTLTVDTAHIARAGVPLTHADFSIALGQARASYSESIGAPKIPNVSWDDVGGLAKVKADILDTIQLPLDHPDLFADGLKKRSGILLYGPPGTGKTLVAKAVATSFSLNFFSIKGPELLNMYIGESEANVRRVFQRAKDAKPCVIFFDELDSIAPKRGNQGDSGGVMDRIVSQLLAELDGSGSSADVFVIGATNRPDLLDPALLRPGRFDRMLYLGVSNTHSAQLNILEALTRKFRLSPDLDLNDIAQQCSFNYTGADFYALCSDALLNAMTRKAEELEEKIASLNSNPHLHPEHPHPLTPQYYLAEMASDEDIRVEVGKTDFEVALRGLVPSVSQAEMDHYARIQARFSKEQLGIDDV